MDTLLVILILLLFATTGAFAAGYTPYPFGVIVLIFAIAARLLFLKG
jgi:hypothetical protein